MVKGIGKAGGKALLAALAVAGMIVAGPALAGPPENNGSVDVQTFCTLDANKLMVTALVTDMTNDDGSAIIDKIEFTCEQQTSPGKNGRETCEPTSITVDFDPDKDLSNGTTTQSVIFEVDLLRASEAKGRATVFCTNCRKNVADNCEEVVLYEE